MKGYWSLGEPSTQRALSPEAEESSTLRTPPAVVAPNESPQNPSIPFFKVYGFGSRVFEVEGLGFRV